MSQPPPRGARAGVKQDIQRLKDQGAGFEAGPSTTAWTHDFLNKKPWHPLNFRNQAKRYEVEQAAIAKEKRESAAKAEFEAEQQYLDTLAHLPSRDADKFRQMQGLAMQEDVAARAPQKNASEGPHASQPDAAATAPTRNFRPKTQEERGQGTKNALAIRFKRRPASPPVGGFTWQDANQEMLVDDTVPGANALSEALAQQTADRRAASRHGNAADRAKHKRRREHEGKKRKRHRRDGATIAHDHGRIRSASPSAGLAHSRKYEAVQNANGRRTSPAAEATPQAGRMRARDRKSCSSSPDLQASGPKDKKRSRSKHRRRERSERQAEARAADIRVPASPHVDKHSRLQHAMQTLIESGYDVEELLNARS